VLDIQNIERVKFMKVGILYHRFLDDEGDERLIGGIQTYILNLANLCKEKQWEPIIFQCSNKEFEKVVEGIKVIGVKRKGKNVSSNISLLYQKACVVMDKFKDIIVFGADHCSIKTGNKRCISIQHGISWDMPTKALRPNAMLVDTFIGGWFWKLKVIRDAIIAFENCSNSVCVDYNFLNWYKAVISGDISGNTWVIPNFSVISPSMLINKKINQNEKIRILFARRFTEYRGSRIMAVAAKKILQEYENIEFTFAGEGPDEAWLKKLLGHSDRVKFIKYLPHETQKILAEHHISIVPSLSSEGTSLSVVEAMSVGGVVIASSVGGITNMIIDGYNGIMIPPSTDEIHMAIKFLLEEPSKRLELAKRGYESAREGFGINEWKNRWVEVIEDVKLRK